MKSKWQPVFRASWDEESSVLFNSGPENRLGPRLRKLIDFSKASFVLRLFWKDSELLTELASYKKQTVDLGPRIRGRPNKWSLKDFFGQKQNTGT